jgi:hypothetical protein
MSGGIYLLQSGDSLVRMDEQPYESEALLQELLAKYPNLMAGEQMDSARPRRWLLIKREAELASEEDGANRWSVDHLFLDQDGIPTIVEVKRSSDTRIRREVVGQMLDYAANAVVYWPAEDIRAKFEARCEVEGRDVEQEMEEFLAGEVETENFWTQVKTNLQAGKIRLLFVADEIPTELRRIVEFLNQQMQFAEVLAIEIRQFVGQGMKTLVPRVIGLTAESERAKSRTTTVRRDWDEDLFLKDLQERAGEDAVKFARHFLEWVKPKTDRISYGHGQTPIMIPLIERGGRAYGLFRLASNGTFRVLFYKIRKQEPFTAEAKCFELLKQLNEIPSVSIPQTAIEGMPAIALSAIQTETGFAQMTKVFEWFLQQTQAS